MDSTAQMDERDITSNCSSQNLEVFPIAIRKGTRACTKHPINRFVGYSSLMPSFQALTAFLDAKQIPQNIDETLRNPTWKRAVEEEISALEKNATWSIADLSPGKKGSGLQMDIHH
ncbi:hypothetical protein GQ457_14G014290 [Hibiscus cannabinus]